MAGGYSVTFSVVDNATKQIDAINRRLTAMRAPMDRMSKSVSRFVDVSGLRKVGQGFEAIGKAAGSLLRTLVEMVPVLGTITGAATLAGMAKLVGSYADWSRQLTATADGLGMTTAQVQRFEDAMRLAGGKASDMDAALQGLYKNTTDFVRGQASSDTIGWLNRLGINVRDSTGHLRSMNDLMPEVIKKISAIENPADRAAAAAALLGESGNKVVEGFRQSSKGFEGFFRDAARYTAITDEQRKQLEAFSEAQGRIGTAFDHLGQQISATLAKNFTPLINHLAEFVEKHQPEIVAAVDRISAKFAAWLEGIDWSKVQAGLDSLLQSLTWISTHLDDIVKVGEVIAAIFVIKWGVEAVAAITKVVAALGTAGGAGGAGGTGLLGKLAMAGNLATLAWGAYQKMNDPETFNPKNFAPDSPFWGNMPKDEQLKYPQSPASREQRGETGNPNPYHWWNPGSWLRGESPADQAGDAGRALVDRFLHGPANLRPGAGGSNAPGSDAQYTPQAGAPEVQLQGDTSWGDYGTRANNPGNLNYAGWEGAAGRFSYRDPHTGGMHSMAVFKTMEEGVAANYKLLARNQQRYGQTLAGALHGYAENDYTKTIAKQFGVDPNAQFDISKADPKMVQALLRHQYTIEGRRGSHTVSDAQIAAGIALGRGETPATAVAANTNNPALVPHRMMTADELDLPGAQRAAGAPVHVPPAGTVNGNVDINIRHTNPPPNAAVTATGSGAVTVAPPRVEYQDFNAA